MRAELIRLFAVAGIAVAALSSPRRAEAVGCTLNRYEWEWQGACPGGRFLQVWNVASCCTGREIFRQPVYFNVPCVQPGTNMSTFPADGEMWAYQCGDPNVNCSCATPTEEVCDGVQDVSGPLVDVGCGDESSCQASARDTFPLTFGTGDIQSNPIELMVGPGAGLPFAYSVVYDSRVRRAPAVIRTTGGLPLIRFPIEDNHFMGHGWLDNYSDRLMLNGPTRVAWQSIDAVITFEGSGTAKLSHAKKYALVDRGAGTAPRYVVSTMSALGTREYWEFSEFALPQGAPILWLTARGTDAGYRIDIQRLADGRRSEIVDSFGRRLRFTYSAGRSYRLARMTLAIANGPETDVATFSYTADGDLDRIEHAGTYHRFVYRAGPSGTSGLGNALLGEVIVPVSQLASVAPGAPAQPDEMVVEGHQYVFAAGQLPRGARTYGPGREWAYVYSGATTVQLDLHQPGDSCAPGCADGYACWTAQSGGDNVCYVATSYTHDTATRLPIARSRPSIASSEGRVVYSSVGTPRSVTGGDGIRTTYAYSAAGDLLCKVINDDDDEAAADPAHPENGCDPSVTGLSRSISFSYSETNRTATTTQASVLAPGGQTTSVETYNEDGLLTSVARTGYTRDIDGVVSAVTRMTTYAYDGHGRLVAVNGPLPDGEAYDVTEYVYWDDVGAGHSHGQLRYVRQHVGVASDTRILQTELADYDAQGVPRRQVGPAGEIMTLATTDRRVWTVTTGAGVTTVTLNGNGTVRSVVDADGVCITYDYRSGSELVPMPTLIKRTASSSSACGALPIDAGTGEVERREYAFGEAERPTRVTRMRDGVVSFELSGFEYGPSRELREYTPPGAPGPFRIDYRDGVMSSVESPSWSAAGSWRTEAELDDLARPATMFRRLSPSLAHEYRYEYATAASIQPTRLTRGATGATALTSTFVYDDFGQMVEVAAPDHGVARYQHDIGGNLVLARVGVGTALQRTDAFERDSQGRLLRVDRDVEHPVDCSTAVEGTPIGDVELAYDSCGSDAPAGFMCSAGSGQVVAARSILHCSGGAVVTRGRWYARDGAGLLTDVAFATITGAGTGAAAVMSMSWSAGGRLDAVTSPLDPAFGTVYTRNAVGDTTALATSGGTALLTDVQYRPFGPVYDARAPLDDLALRLSATHRADYGPAGLHWGLEENGTEQLAYMSQVFTYAASGLLADRADGAQPAASRHYQYDALLRLRCEARGAVGHMPSAADCASGPLAARYTYLDGASAAEPPDNRATVAGDGGIAVESYEYAAGTNRLERITAAGGQEIVLGHDVVGRRTFEYDAADPVASRRDYQYLPSGQLGRIDGVDVAGAPYHVLVNYDVDGRPLTIRQVGTTERSVELFHDEGGRLIAARVTRGSIVERWSFHFLGGAPIAASRVTVGATTDVHRFWFVTDERGLVHRVVDHGGFEHFRATYDASGRRTAEVHAADLWMPFGLQGQVVLDGTEATAVCGTGCARVRPPLALNHMRVYDPHMARFLEPDSGDLSTRMSPEGYSYGRNALGAAIDPTGMSASWPEWMTPVSGSTFFLTRSCQQYSERITEALSTAIQQLDACRSGLCAFPGSQALRTQWSYFLYRGQWDCPGKGEIATLPHPTTERMEPVKYVLPYPGIQDGPGGPNQRGQRNGMFGDERGGASYAANRYVRGTSYTILAPIVFAEKPFVDGHGNLSCLRKTVAHEALHSTLHTTSALTLFGADGFLEGDRLWPRVMRIRNRRDHGADSVDSLLSTSQDGSVIERFVRDTVNACINCDQ
jgi:hypothetical protein